ncbi:unnamed protein product [Lampetra planeri]
MRSLHLLFSVILAYVGISDKSQRNEKISPSEVQHDIHPDGTAHKVLDSQFEKGSQVQILAGGRFSLSFILG